MRTSSKLLLIVAASGVMATTSGAAAAPPDAPREKIGLIGAGKIGGTLASLWVKAGHPVMISSRHPDQLRPLAESLGPQAKVGTPRQAAEYGDVVVVAVPYGAMPEISRDLGPILKGKIVLDTGNPVPARDGEMANEARRKGAGPASAEFLPGARLVRAFNSIGSRVLQSEAHRAGEPLAIPLASDDEQALATAQRLVREAGFEPVVVGPLSKARLFDQGGPAYGPHTARELRELAGVVR